MRICLPCRKFDGPFAGETKMDFRNTLPEWDGVSTYTSQGSLRGSANEAGRRNDMERKKMAPHEAGPALVSITHRHAVRGFPLLIGSPPSTTRPL